ncbi:MAG: ATP-binding protein [Kiritimatiellae bacterium]|nr:ATP-binding protein [Kiritimatiellia bacterium]
MKEYRAFLICLSAYYLVDSLWGVLAGMGATTILYFDTVFYYLLVAVSVFLWSRYAVAYLGIHDWRAKLLRISGRILFAFHVVALGLNFFNGSFFSFTEQGAYVAGPLRHVALCLLASFNLLSAAFALAQVLHTQVSSTRHRRHLTILIFCLTMTLASILQVLWPLLPLYAIGCLFGCCILHAFVIEDEREALRNEMLMHEREASEHVRAERTLFDDMIAHVVSRTSNAESMNFIIAGIGAHVGADRCYVYYYQKPGESPIADNVYEWCSQGIEPVIDSQQSCDMSVLPDFHETIVDNRIYSFTDITTIHPGSRDWLEPQGIQSLIAAPFHRWDGQVLGFVGFDFVNHAVPEFGDHVRRNIQAAVNLIEACVRLNHEREQSAAAAQALKDMDVGIWSIEQEGNLPPRMYGNAVMDLLLGCSGAALTREAYYQNWRDHVHPDYQGKVQKFIDDIASGQAAEVQYPFNHPTLGEIWVRSGGRRDAECTTGLRIVGRHQNVTELIQTRQQSLDVMTALGREYHTLWLVEKETRRMRLVRTTGKSTIKSAVAMARAVRDYDATHAKYLEANVDPRDRERVRHEASCAVVLEKIAHFPLYTVNYRRIDDAGVCSHHQMAFADAGNWFILGFRDIEDMVRKELEAQERAEKLNTAQKLAEVEQDRADKERCINESLGVLLATSNLSEALLKIMSMWCEALDAQWCFVGRWEGDSYHIIQSYAVPGETPLCKPGGVTAHLQSLLERMAGIGESIHDYLPMPDFRRHAYFNDFVRVSLRPDAMREASSCYRHVVRLEGKAWGTLVLLFRDRHDLSVNEELFFKAAVHGIELALVRQKHMQEIEAERDRAVEAEKSKRLFFSSVSHDIRTPLNAIVGFSELLEQGGETPEERIRYISTIRSSGKVLARLIDDILDLAKLEDGNMEIISEPTDVSAVAREVVEAFGVSRARKSIFLGMEADEMPQVDIDAQRVRQILYNLLSNAFKFTDKGQIVLKSRWVDGTLRLSVSDTGRGISETDIERILQPFVQVKDRNHRDGTGLGLPICRKLAELMGGTLTIESKLGEGSTFTVSFPHLHVVPQSAVKAAAPVAAHAAPVVAAVPPSGAKSVSEIRVLAVDDSTVNLLILRNMLKRCGVTDIVTAENGHQALDMLKQDKPFDIVFSDLWMPEMDGEGLIKEIRADKTLADLPVYLVTADVEITPNYQELGFSGILLKPITLVGIKNLLQSSFVA